MHILALLLGVVGAVGLIVWRVREIASASLSIGDAALDALDTFRRWDWQRKITRPRLDLVVDPREAAVTMMVALAQSDGDLTERERGTILRTIEQHFGATRAQAEALLAHGRWFARDADVDQCFSRLAPLLRQGCTPEQLEDVLAMLEDVAAAEGVPADIERNAVSNLRRDLSG